MINGGWLLLKEKFKEDNDYETIRKFLKNNNYLIALILRCINNLKNNTNKRGGEEFVKDAITTYYKFPYIRSLSEKINKCTTNLNENKSIKMVWTM